MALQVGEQVFIVLFRAFRYGVMNSVFVTTVVVSSGDSSGFWVLGCWSSRVLGPGAGVQGVGLFCLGDLGSSMIAVRERERERHRKRERERDTERERERETERERERVRERCPIRPDDSIYKFSMFYSAYALVDLQCSTWNTPVPALQACVASGLELAGMNRGFSTSSGASAPDTIGS